MDTNQSGDVYPKETVGPERLDISRMYFSLWKPPGVSERMWSVNLGPSISGEYQTLGGHSDWPLE